MDSFYCHFCNIIFVNEETNNNHFLNNESCRDGIVNILCYHCQEIVYGIHNLSIHLSNGCGDISSKAITITPTRSLQVIVEEDLFDPEIDETSFPNNQIKYKSTDNQSSSINILLSEEEKGEELIKIFEEDIPNNQMGLYQQLSDFPDEFFL